MRIFSGGRVLVDASDNAQNSVISPHDLKTPIALDPRNFTSLKRTPWAGSELAAGIKSRQADFPSQRIGESWEMSCDPEAPSRLKAQPHITLAELIEQFPEECLSRELIAVGRKTCDVLVKLLNADSPLSLQIHPSDNHPALKPNECGKPESWLVLSAKPGCGFYLGFSQALSVTEISAKLQSGQFNADLLQFVPVKPGDYFEIEPHVPHAIGPGVVLLEPQRIIAGKSGKTWRMWDWNRRYGQDGDLDPANGKARELHISESMTLLNPTVQCGMEYAEKLRRTPQQYTPAKGVTVDLYPANPWYQTLSIAIAPHARMKLAAAIRYGCLTVISGALNSGSESNTPIQMLTGETFFLPNSCLPRDISTSDSPAHVTLVIPAGSGTLSITKESISKIFL